MTSVPEITSNTAAAFLTVELPELLGITGTAHADALEALAAVLADAHISDDLPPADANRVAETVALEVIRCGWALADAADAVTDRAIAPQLDRRSDLDDRMAVGLALHRAARVLEESWCRLEPFTAAASALLATFRTPRPLRPSTAPAICPWY